MTTDLDPSGVPDTVISPGGSDFLEGADELVQEHLQGSVSLPQFLAGAGTLTRAQRLLLVEQALVLLEQNYVHLPLKSALHTVNPVQRLRMLRSRLLRASSGGGGPEWQFHAEMSEIFHSVRDLHTNYSLPLPFAGKIAYLPFQVEEYAEAGTARYVVSRLVQGFSAPGFGPGSEITHWNGIPMRTAVELNGDRFAGSNDAARRSRGAQSMALRPLRAHLPPYEEWVTVTYTDQDGRTHELRQEWLVADTVPAFADVDTVSTTAATLGIDVDGDDVRRATTVLFAPGVLRADRRARAAAPVAAAAGDLPTTMPKVFRAREVTTSHGTFGHLRIFTFAVDDPDGFVAEFVRLVERLPQHGLVLDVRDNGGGHIHAAEFTLQTLTPRHVVPEPVQFISTPLNLRLCRKHADNPLGVDLGPWFPSLDQAGEIAATYSAAVPITPEERANDIGQRYHGPVVLVTNARCYSATDIFAAGFQDHGVGPVLGVDGNTGAGGANVWTHGLLKALLDEPTPEPDTPFRDLPNGADMRVAIRRTLRVGPNAGTPLEDLGVVPDRIHPMTRADVLEGNTDLLEAAGALLATMPVRRLSVTRSASGTDLELAVEVTGIDRVDMYADGRPLHSSDVDGSVQVTLTGAADAAVVRVEGYEDGALVAARTLRG